MNKTLRNLTILLGLQVLLASALWMSNNTTSKGKEITALLTVDFSQMDKIIVTEDSKQATLQKVNDSWQLPNYGNLSISDEKVTTLLDKLKGLSGSWPVATTSSAAERFEVSEENAQKKIAFYDGDNLISTLFVGTSPGFRKVHTRVDDRDEIFAVEFAQYEAPAEDKDWFDKNVLRFSNPIKTVTADGFSLSQPQQDQWTVSPVEPNQTAKNDAIKTWAARFSSLQVTKLVEDNTAEGISSSNPEKVINIEGDQGKVEYRFYKKDSSFYLKSSQHPKLFEIASYQAEPIIAGKLTDFITEAEAEKPMDNPVTLPPLLGNPES